MNEPLAIIRGKARQALGARKRETYEMLAADVVRMAAALDPIKEGSPEAHPRQPHGESGLFMHEPGAPCVVCGRTA